MKTNKFFSFISLFFALAINSQTCTVNFIYSLSQNGNITFTNTSTPASPTVPATYTWNTGNGVPTQTTNSISQTINSTFTASGVYSVSLYSSCGAISKLVTYTMTGCSLTASMTASNSAPFSPTVNFTNLSTGTIGTTTYLWKFGDGGTDTIPNPTHIYTLNGVYSYTLTATNSPACKSIIVANGGAPNPPSLVPVCYYTPLLTHTVNTAGSTSLSISATAPGWNLFWSFGDYQYENAQQASSPTANHVYFNGAYAASVNMSNTGMPSCNFNLSDTVNITNDSCLANGAFTYTAGAGGSVQFSKTAPISNTNIAYYWYFGDGVSSNQVNPNHIYSSAGNYIVTFICYDLRYPINNPIDTSQTPCSVKSKINMNITGVPCIANSNFTVIPMGTGQGYLINMTYPYNFSAVSWDWGDGSTSNTIYANHIYSAPGNYNICLTVTTSCGAISSTCLSNIFSGNAIYVYGAPSQISNSIEENIADNIILEVFPNPSEDGILNLRSSKDFGAEEIEVDDLVGKEVLITRSPSNERSFKIDVSTLNNGIYFLKLKSSQSRITSKFIISR